MFFFCLEFAFGIRDNGIVEVVFVSKEERSAGFSMAQISVHVRTPMGTAVKTYINGQEASSAEVQMNEPVRIRVEQTKTGTDESIGHKLTSYMKALTPGRKIRYGLDVPSPFRAQYEGELIPKADSERIAFTLVTEDGHFALIPDEPDRFRKETVRNREINDDRAVWGILLGSILAVLLIVYALAMVALFGGEEIPALAKALFGALYTVLAGTAAFLFIRKMLQL